MEILARAVGRRKEAVAQVQMVPGSGQLVINTKPANDYLQNDSCTILGVQAPFEIFKSATSTQENSSTAVNLDNIDTIVTVKGGGLKGQADAIRLGIARALCVLDAGGKTSTIKSSTTIEVAGQNLKKQLKDKGYLTQDSRVKERRKYGLKKARKATQYNKR